MSTVSVSYPEVIRVRRAPAIGRILILSSFVFLAITTLVMVTSAHADLTNRAAISQNSISPIPVPTAPGTAVQPVPAETPMPASALTSQPSAVPVPVPIPPSQ